VRGGRGALLSAALACAAGGCADPSYGRSSSAASDSERTSDGGASASDAQPSAPRGNARDASSQAQGQADGLDAASGPPSRGTGSDDAATAQPDLTASDGDASTPMSAAVPAWGMPLVGQYALRAFTLKQDDFQAGLGMLTGMGDVTRHEQVFLVEFKLVAGGGMQLRQRLCRSEAKTSIADLLLLKPDSAPERVEDVMFSESEQRWSTVGATSTMGYSAEPPTFCVGKQGNDVAHDEAQVWLGSGPCRCPILPDPPTRDDCRVNDADFDMNPGVTFELTGPTGLTKIYAGNASDSHFVNGQVGGDGMVHTANVRASEQPFQFGCDSSSCADLASLGKYCAASFNQARFVRLDPASAPSGGFRCSDVVSRVDALFPEPPPALTASCAH
jgi:hypothetical protein